MFIILQLLALSLGSEALPNYNWLHQTHHPIARAFPYAFQPSLQLVGRYGPAYHGVPQLVYATKPAVVPAFATVAQHPTKKARTEYSIHPAKPDTKAYRYALTNTRIARPHYIVYDDDDDFKPATASRLRAVQDFRKAGRTFRYEFDDDDFEFDRDEDRVIVPSYRSSLRSFGYEIDDDDDRFDFDADDDDFGYVQTFTPSQLRARSGAGFRSFPIFTKFEREDDDDDFEELYDD